MDMRLLIVLFPVLAAASWAVLNLLFKKKKVTEPNESFSLSGTYSSVV